MVKVKSANIRISDTDLWRVDGVNTVAFQDQIPTILV